MGRMGPSDSVVSFSQRPTKKRAVHRKKNVKRGRAGRRQNLGGLRQVAAVFNVLWYHGGSGVPNVRVLKSSECLSLILGSLSMGTRRL